MATTVCFVENTNSPERITAASQIGIDNYQTVLEIPSSRFTTGHDYVVVFSGTFGEAALAGSSIPEVMPYLGTFPFGTYLTNQRSSGGVSNSAHRPYFALYRNSSWPASTKLAVLATNRSVSGAAAFMAQASIMVWDLTALTAAGIPWVWAPSVAPRAFPVSPASPVTVASLTLPSTGNWLSFYYVSCLPAGDSFVATSKATHYWTLNGTWLNNDKVRIKANAAASQNVQWSNGKVLASTLTLGGTNLVEASIQDEASTANGPSQFVNAHAFLVKQDARLLVESTGAGAIAGGFWSQTFPYDSQELLLTSTPAYYYSNIAIGQVNNPVDVGPPYVSYPGSSQLTIEGDPIAGPIVPIAPHDFNQQTMPASRVPMHRIGKHAHGGGRHYVSFRGGIYPVTSSAAPPPPLSGDDAQIIILNGILDVIPPAPTPETPGPVVAFTPQRESPVAIASLPLLSVQPSWSKPITREMPMRELRTPSGYMMASPRFSRAVERLTLAWDNRKSSDIDAVVAFFESLDATQAAFRWRPPWESSDQAYAIENWAFDEKNELQRNVRSLSAEAIKLVWVPP